MAHIRLTDVNDETSRLLTLAADRVGMKKHPFINKILDKAAGKELAQLEMEKAVKEGKSNGQ